MIIRAFISIILLVVLAACAPTLNSITGDEAELLYVTNPQEGPCAPTPDTGLCFVPSGKLAQDISINVLANSFTAVDETCVASENGYNCPLGDALTPTFIMINGQGVTASARYRRAGSNRWYQEFAH